MRERRLPPSLGGVGRPARLPAGQHLWRCPKSLPAILSRHSDSCPSSGTYTEVREHFETVFNAVSGLLRQLSAALGVAAGEAGQTLIHHDQRFPVRG